MGGPGWERFKSEVIAWWPILTMILAISLTGILAVAKASDTLEAHEIRLGAVEQKQASDSLRLRTIEVQTANTDKTVDRLEHKVDRLLERRP